MPGNIARAPGIKTQLADMLIETVSPVLWVAVAFVASNIDNLLLLVTLSALAPVERVVSGYLLAAGTVVLLALMVFSLGAAVDPALLGYLGLLPLTLGLYRGVRAVHPRQQASATASAQAGTCGVYLLMLSNSGDTLALLLPLFADTRPGLLPAMCVTYAVMALFWLLLTRLLLRQQALARGLARQERWLLPAVMIAVGIFVLMDTAGDRLLPSFSAAAG